MVPGDIGTVILADLNCYQESNNFGRVHMQEYETPTITELGSVADFTRAEVPGRNFDGRHTHGSYKPPAS